MSSSSTSRRDFLILGAGSAAVVAAGLEVTTPAPVLPADGKVSVGAGPLSGSLVAHVKDLRGETISLLIGEREIVVRDAALVARLASAAR
jgi:hypothetical protein